MGDGFKLIWLGLSHALDAHGADQIMPSRTYLLFTILKTEQAFTPKGAMQTFFSQKTNKPLKA